MLYMMMSRITRSIYIHTHIHTYSHSVYTVFEDIVGVVCRYTSLLAFTSTRARHQRERVESMLNATLHKFASAAPKPAPDNIPKTHTVLR